MDLKEASIWPRSKFSHATVNFLFNYDTAAKILNLEKAMCSFAYCDKEAIVNMIPTFIDVILYTYISDIILRGYFHSIFFLPVPQKWQVLWRIWWAITWSQNKLERKEWRSTRYCNTFEIKLYLASSSVLDLSFACVQFLIIDRTDLAKQGDDRFGSVCLSVCALLFEPLGLWPSVISWRMWIIVWMRLVGF